MRNKITIIALFAFFIDQIVKLLAASYLTSISLIPGFFSLIYAKNEGVAFSMFWGNRWFIIIISILLILFLIYTIKKEYIEKNENSNFKNITYGILIGGIFGNLFDRIFRGYVIDYIALNLFGYSFPIFNLADVAITFGVVLLIIDNIKESKNN